MIAFGTAGTYAIILAALMISLVLITQRSIFDMIRKFSQYLYDSAARRQEERREAARLQREEEEKAGRTGREAETPQGKNSGGKG